MQLCEYWMKMIETLGGVRRKRQASKKRRMKLVVSGSCCVRMSGKARLGVSIILCSHGSSISSYTLRKAYITSIVSQRSSVFATERKI